MKDCIVFGNGGSLKNFDFKKIDRNKHDIIGCCLAFRFWNKINFYPDIYVNVDDIVCSRNLEVRNFVMEKKCKYYLLSDKIKNIWNDIPNDGSIIFIQDLIKENHKYFRYIRGYCSGSSAVLFSLGLYNNIRLAGIDCDYIELIPECKKKRDGSLKIIKTPEKNPNYFFDDYQREGDDYNVPNGTSVHLKSWEQLNYILEFINKMFPEYQKKITNFNEKKSIREYFYTRPLNEIYSEEIFHKKRKKKKRNGKKIAFCIPSTTNLRNWNDISETYLYSILLPSIIELSEEYNIKLFIGYDDDDKLYSNIILPNKYQGIELDWTPFTDCKGNPCKIWTELCKNCIDQGYEYYMVCGDDIHFDSNKEWLNIFIERLKNNNNIGYSAGYSNNDLIPTQFLFHKNHYEIFGWIFPPQIKNWQCDNFIYNIYNSEHIKYGNWLKEYKHYNVGGEPRYSPDNCIKLRIILVDKFRPNIKKFINKN